MKGRLALAAVTTIGLLAATGETGASEKLSLRVTPNGDGVNDLWTIRGLEAYPLQQVQVYNSYGQLVFQSSNFSSWNGSYRNKPLPVGTYYYLISVPERPLIKGYVDILR